MYYRPETNQVFRTHNDIRNGMLFVLFSENMDDETLSYHGVFPVTLNKPAVTAEQVAEEVGLIELDGKWSMQYEVRDLTEAEIEAMKPPVPARVSRRQARSALLIRGFLDQVPVAIAAIPNEGARRLAQIEWEDATEFDRSRDLVIQIGAALGLDSKGLDDIFRLAATL